jgi:DNA-binding NarL/FixJ family response regulator
VSESMRQARIRDCLPAILAADNLDSELRLRLGDYTIHPNDALDRLPVSSVVLRALALRSQFFLRTGFPEDARTVLKDVALGPDTVLSQAELALHGTNLGLDTAIESWAPPDWPSARIAAALARATIAESLGKRGEAKRCLSFALEEAAIQGSPGKLLGLSRSVSLHFLDLPKPNNQAVEAMLRTVVDALNPTQGDGRSSQVALTGREYAVLRALAGPHTQKQIAANLFVSENTLKSHLQHLYRKLAVSNRASAVEVARARRLLDSGG